MGIHYHRHVHHHYMLGDDKTLEKILSTLQQLRGKDMADLKSAFADLQAKVANQTTVDASVLALLSGLRQQLRELADQETIDPADVKALADTLATEQNRISFAVTQGTGTPAAPGTPANPIPQTPVVNPIQDNNGAGPSGVAPDAPAVQPSLVEGEPGVPADTSTGGDDNPNAEAPTQAEQAQQVEGSGEPQTTNEAQVGIPD